LRLCAIMRLPAPCWLAEYSTNLPFYVKPDSILEISAKNGKDVAIIARKHYDDAFWFVSATVAEVGYLPKAKIKDIASIRAL
jgi:hypothetical protein